MPQQGRFALSFGLLTTFVSQTIATTIVQSFAAANCNPGTASDVYYSEEAAVADTTCKTSPPNTFAVWVDDIAAESGCSIRTFASDGCTDVRGLSIGPGFCYYPSDFSPIRSWRIVCGAQDSENPVPAALESSSAPERSFMVDAIFASDSPSNASSTGTPPITSAISPNTTASAIIASGSGGASSNSSAFMTWSNTLSPSSNPTTREASPSGGSGTGGQVSGATSHRQSRKPDVVMLVLGSLLGLGWGVLW